MWKKIQAFEPYFAGAPIFDFTVITIHTQQLLNVEAEIDELNYILNTFINPPHCFSGNAIIMGDFNQVEGFVADNFQSTLDKGSQYRQLVYKETSTLSQALDRLDTSYEWCLSQL